MSKTSSPILNHPTILMLDSTKLQAWQTCPRRFFFEYVLGWRPGNPSIHLTFGVAWHLAMDYLLVNGNKPENVKPAFDIFLAAWRKEVNEMMDTLHEPKDPANAFKALELYVSTYPKEDFKVLHKEIPGRVTLADGHGWERDLYINLDAIVENADGTLRVLDHKTTTYNSAAWQQGFALSMQVGAYIHALYGLTDPHNVWGLTINGVILRSAKTTRGKGNEFIRIDIQRTTDQQEAWLDEASHTAKEIESHVGALFDPSTDITTPHPDLFPRRTVSCTKYNSLCPFHGFCSTVRNPFDIASHYGPADAPPGFTKAYWNPETHTEEGLNLADSVDLTGLLEKLERKP